MQRLADAAGAAEKARTDTSLHPLTRASILVNAGVADMSAADVEAAVKQYDEAEAIGRKFSTGRAKIAGTPTLAASLRYNRALLLAASTKAEDLKSAVDSFERYLTGTSPASAWWPLAYDRYAKLCKDLGRAPKSKADLTAGAKPTLRRSPPSPCPATCR